MQWITDSNNYVLMKFNECYLPGQNTFKPLTFTVPISCSLSLMRIWICFFTLMQIWLPKMLLLVKIFIDFWYILDKKDIYTIVRFERAKDYSISMWRQVRYQPQRKIILERYYFFFLEKNKLSNETVYWTMIKNEWREIKTKRIFFMCWRWCAGG